MKKLKSIVGDVLRQIRRIVYRGPVREMIRAVGVHRSIGRLYWRVLFVLSQDIVTLTVENVTSQFRVDSFSEFRRFRGALDEEVIIRDLLESLKPDDVFFDVGANIGTYTCFVAGKLGSGSTVAFEPCPNNAGRLSDNLQLNDLDARVIAAALSDRDALVSLYLHGMESGEGEHAIIPRETEDAITVQSYKGDSVVEKAGILGPTVMKIDVEGAENLVLSGFQRVLEEDGKCRLLYVEVHPDKMRTYGGSESQLHSYLRSCGFELTRMPVEHRKEYMLKASRRRAPK